MISVVALMERPKEDECLAPCYTKIGDMNTAVSIFNTVLYGDLALKYNSNACRCYLQYVYPQASLEQRIDLEHRYYNHFLLVQNKVVYSILFISRYKNPV